ncbi:Zinc finger, GRF-type [Sesbania bispinosa]|nr:Zinc finger, GRF-type [Sesbania bispinosa]
MRYDVSAPEKRVAATHIASTSSSHAYPKRRTCGCGAKVVLIKSKTANNPGRMFWRCPYWSCNYFKWVDEDRFTEEDESEMIEEQKKKIMKLKTKLDAERRKGKMMMGIVFRSWFIIVIVCLLCVGKCPCNLV